MKRLTMLSALLLCVPMFTLVLFPIGPIDLAVGQETRAGGRLVFAEDITAQWCVYCPSASEGLLEVSHSRDDFRFVCLIDDMVQEAADRTDEYNPAGYPTVVFDGGYENQVGGVSSTDSYNEKIDACHAREDVPDLSVDVICLYTGDATLSITVEVTNNDGSDYTGTLKVYVVEKVSRFLDYDGNNYPQGLLGFALDEEVSISSGEVHSGSAQWSGGDHSSIGGEDFSDIDPDNLVIYAVVFNSRTNVNYYPGIPPKPYTAHYSDAVGEAFPVETSGIPDVEITSPRNGADVEDEVEIRAEVTSDASIEVVEVKLGSEDWEEMEQAGGYYSYLADVSGYPNGDLRISVRATDEYELAGIASITVQVENEDFLQGPEIGPLTHSPGSPTADDIITVYAPIDEYDTTITSVELTYCLDGICNVPMTMTNEGGGIYSIEIGPFLGGVEVSYSAMVYDDQGKAVISPDYVFTVLPGAGGEPADDDETEEPVGASTESSSVISMPLIIGVIALIISLLVVVYMLTRSRGED